MTEDPYLKKVFPQPPMVAYKRTKSLKDLLVKAKVPPLLSRKSTRQLKCMKKCNKCNICPYVKECKSVTSSYSPVTVDINCSVNCTTPNVIYLITCTKCKDQYIGQTGRPVKERMKEHLRYIKNKMLTEPTGLHFNLPGHDMSMFTFTVLEKCPSISSRSYREEREEHFIKLFQTKFKGMNRKL